MSAKSLKLLSYPEAEGHADSGPGWPRGGGWGGGGFFSGTCRLMGILAIIRSLSASARPALPATRGLLTRSITEVCGQHVAADGIRQRCETCSPGLASNRPRQAIRRGRRNRRLRSVLG